MPAKKTAKRKTTPACKLALVIATRKGLWIMKSDTARKSWKLDGPKFLGQIINHAVLDPRDKRTMLVSASTGHLGPTLYRSTDAGRTFKEVKQPPAFAKVPEGGDGNKGRSVGHTFWLTPAHANEPNVWYAGTSPQGLFRTGDGGDTWAPFSSVNDDPKYREWMGTVQDGTPDGPKMHSIIVDPRDAKHMYFGMSGGGVHETCDGGATWKVLIGGMDVVEGFGFDPKLPTFHDPHVLRMCPSNPNRIYQQNHCGIYRIDRPSDTWVRIGKSMPKSVGDIGFPLVVHPRNDNTAWVFPMDGTQVWPRVSPEGKPAVYVTKNAGKTWQKQNTGMPKSQAWWTVKRQAMTGDACDPVGLYFGTTSGEVWMSRDEGKKWACIAAHLPEIYAVETAHV